MSYLKIKNIIGEEEVFIPSSVLAQKFDRKENHVNAKLQAIMYLPNELELWDLPMRKMSVDGKVIYADLDDYGNVNVYSNKELTEFVLKDWKNRSNTDIVNEIINEFDKTIGSLVSVELPEPELLKQECIELINDNMEDEDINLPITEDSGKYLLSASKLFLALKLGNLYDFEIWAKKNIARNPMYIEDVDYQERETYNPESQPHFYTDYIIDSNVARELTVISDSRERIKVRNYITAFSYAPIVITDDFSEFVNDIKLNIYYIERYLPLVLNWKTAEDIMPKLLDRCMKEVDSGSIKVEVFSAVIRTALKIVDREKDSTKKELLNKQITKWMTKRAQIYAGIISSVKTENARLKEQLAI